MLDNDEQTSTAAPVDDTELESTVPHLVDDSPKGQERRIHFRRPLRLRVMVATHNQLLHGRTDDISSHGTCLRLDLLIPVKTHIRIRFLAPFIPDQDHFDVAGEVRYSVLTSESPCYRTGIAFPEPPKEFQRWLNRLQ